MSTQRTLSGEVVEVGGEYSYESCNVRTFTANTLAEIDPDTLPRDGWIEEVARRFEARRAGRDGWRTGALETTLDEAEGGR